MLLVSEDSDMEHMYLYNLSNYRSIWRDRYKFSLQIRDITGNLDVILYGRDAVRFHIVVIGWYCADFFCCCFLQDKFLPGIPATNFSESEYSLLLLQHKMDTITNHQLNPNKPIQINNPAILDCCIKSYFVHGKIYYQIFDTILKV